jgi:flagellar basal body-associated protein FliL
VLHGIPAGEDVAMRLVIQALVAMALVAGFGPGAAWSAKDDGKKGFGLENLFGEGDREYYTLQPFTVPIVRDGRIARHVSLLVTLETRGLANKDKILEARKRLRDSFLRDLHGVMSIRRKDGRSFKTSVLKKRLMAVSKRVLGEDIVRDILIETAFERRFR